MTYELFLQDARDDGYNKGFNEGRNEDLREGRNEGKFSNELKKLKIVMRKMGLTLDEAMEFLETPKEDRAKYASALANNIDNN